MNDRLVDAGLAAGGLGVVLAVAALAGVGGDPTALAAGVVGALVLELLLQHRQRAVRRAWDRSDVKAAVAGAFLAVLTAAVAVAPAAGLSVLAGGLVGYLALLAGAAAGALGRA